MVRFLILFNFSLDILDSPFWKETANLKDPSLCAKAGNLKSLVMASKASNTVKKYSYAWSRWKAWANERIGFPVLPAQPLTIALYINDPLESSKSASVLESAFYATQWAHKLAGFESPTFHPVVRAALEAGRRAVGKPVSPKEPLTLDLIQSLAEFYNRPEAKLEQIRFLFTVLVGYAGFMRMDEILSVRCIDISFGETFMTILVPKRKNDQHREGHKVDVAFSGKISCPVLITKRLLSLLPNSEGSCAPLIPSGRNGRNGALGPKTA